MLVVAKHRFLRPSVVVADGTRFRVRREGRGVFRADGIGPSDGGRIEYRDWRDEATIERVEGQLDIRFNERGTDFEWDRRTYHLGDMVDGNIRIRERDRLVVEGSVTVSGVRLNTVTPDLDAVARELAFALALRSERLARRIAPNPGGEAP